MWGCTRGLRARGGGEGKSGRAARARATQAHISFFGREGRVAAAIDKNVLDVGPLIEDLPCLGHVVGQLCKHARGALQLGGAKAAPPGLAHAVVVVAHVGGAVPEGVPADNGEPIRGPGPQLLQAQPPVGAAVGAVQGGRAGPGGHHEWRAARGGRRCCRAGRGRHRGRRTRGRQRHGCPIGRGQRGRRPHRGSGASSGRRIGEGGVLRQVAARGHHRRLACAQVSSGRRGLPTTENPCYQYHQSNQPTTCLHAAQALACQHRWLLLLHTCS